MENAALVRIIVGLAGSSGRDPSPLRLQSSLSLGPRHKLAVIQVEQQRLLIGIGPQGITLLHTLAPEDRLAADATASDDRPQATSRVSPFSSLLAQWLPGAVPPHSRKP